MRAASLAVFLCLPAIAFAAEAPVNLTPGAKARPGLYEEILKADAEFFKAFFDTCDVATVRRYVADDFEMFHDKGGRVSTSAAEFVKTTQEKCQRQAFTQVWKEENGQWRLARVLSYDHQLAEPSGERQ
jgi:hypothetical protein